MKCNKIVWLLFLMIVVNFCCVNAEDIHFRTNDGFLFKIPIEHVQLSNTLTSYLGIRNEEREVLLPPQINNAVFNYVVILLTTHGEAAVNNELSAIPWKMWADFYNMLYFLDIPSLWDIAASWLRETVENGSDDYSEYLSAFAPEVYARLEIPIAMDTADGVFFLKLSDVHYSKTLTNLIEDKGLPREHVDMKLYKKETLISVFNYVHKVVEQTAVLTKAGNEPLASQTRTQWVLASVLAEKVEKNRDSSKEIIANYKIIEHLNIEILYPVWHKCIKDIFSAALKNAWMKDENFHSFVHEINGLSHLKRAAMKTLCCKNIALSPRSVNGVTVVYSPKVTWKFSTNMQSLTVPDLPHGRSLCLMASGASMSATFSFNHRPKIVIFSPGYEYVVIGLEDGDIIFYDGTFGEEYTTMRTGLKDIAELAFSEDGTLLVVTGYADGGEEKKTFNIPPSDVTKSLEKFIEKLASFASEQKATHYASLQRLKTWFYSLSWKPAWLTSYVLAMVKRIKAMLGW